MMKANKAIVLLGLNICCFLQRAMAQLEVPAIAVRITLANASQIHFNTGSGAEGFTNKVEVRIYDVCRFATSDPQTELGVVYPSAMATPVVGITYDASKVMEPNGIGNGSIIEWDFNEELEQNPIIYTRFNESYAEMEFCVQVSLYTDGFMVSWDELDVFVPIGYTKGMGEDEDDEEGQSSPHDEINSGGMGLGMDLGMQVEAEQEFLDAYNFSYSVGPGELNAYFCNPITHEALEGGTVITQDNFISVCFNVIDGMIFEVEDIMELYIANAGGTQEPQHMIASSQVANTYFAEKYCEYTPSNPNIHTCLVNFLLDANYFEYSAVALTGFGAIKLRLEDRRFLVRMTVHSPAEDGIIRRRELQQEEPPAGEVEAAFHVESQYFKTYEEYETESAGAAMWPLLVPSLIVAAITIWGASAGLE
ncbi:expressed unknown protein [Seminavis robusta]|uniref:Uncharacterized protein n=1 Tax=Seminavis robusta TaxID=568900 RepID=A0A9N8DIJ2_9STRA|nr:expressed unknown protein [Seminavis robusta]|eukprot:Sro107_g053900.1 n/a (421) ;mRNA; r:66858-68209